jgi:hypothetical protein
MSFPFTEAFGTLVEKIEAATEREKIDAVS